MNPIVASRGYLHIKLGNLIGGASVKRMLLTLSVASIGIMTVGCTKSGTSNAQTNVALVATSKTVSQQNATTSKTIHEKIHIQGFLDQKFNGGSLDFSMGVSNPNKTKFYDLDNVTLDTGANTFMIPGDIADYLGLPHIQSTNVYGIDGSLMKSYTTTINMTFGKKNFHNIDCVAVYGLKIPLLGSDFFRTTGYKLSVDFQRNSFDLIK
jgi:predicted aspartyl protease